MQETRVLLVFPGSLRGATWAAGPWVKPELVHLLTEVRRAGFAADVLDLEAELGNPEDEVAREAYLHIARGLLVEQGADLVVILCWSALQYTAAVAVAERVRSGLPEAVIAVCGHHVAARPDDFDDPGAPFDCLIAGEPETAVVQVAREVAGGDRSAHERRSIEGTPLPLDGEHRPDYAAYPYVDEGLAELSVYLSRGCPYSAPACLSRSGGAGWHAYPPKVALRLLDELAALKPQRVSVLDPAFGYDPSWRGAMLDRLAADERRDRSIVIGSRPEALRRDDVDGIYRARLGLRLEVGTLSRELLSRTGQAPAPERAVAHAIDLLEYLNAKGVATRVSLTFNQPGETRKTAIETLDALERFVAAAPNTSVSLAARSWAYFPSHDAAADVDAPAARYGTRIVYDRWWRERGDAHAAATAVVASRDLAGLPPGDESYWRPRFEELRERLAAKLTADARRGLRSHETVGSEAYGVPHGWLTEGS